MKDITLEVTCNSDGDGSTTESSAVTPGILYAIEYLPGTIATGATITITDEVPGGQSRTLLVKASAGTANVTFYPRVLNHLNTDGSALTEHVHLLVNGRPKFLVASGGNGGKGKVRLYIMEA